MKHIMLLVYPAIPNINRNRNIQMEYAVFFLNSAIFGIIMEVSTASKHQNICCRFFKHVIVGNTTCRYKIMQSSWPQGEYRHLKSWPEHTLTHAVLWSSNNHDMKVLFPVIPDNSDLIPHWKCSDSGREHALVPLLYIMPNSETSRCLFVWRYIM